MVVGAIAILYHKCVVTYLLTHLADVMHELGQVCVFRSGTKAQPHHQEHGFQSILVPCAGRVSICL